MEFVPLGEQEMEVLAYVTEHTPVSASQVAEGWGEAQGLARTTVLTVMERLRKKGYLVRHRRNGVFQYSPRMSRSELLQGLLGRFVETTLGGSLAPVVAYLSNNRQLSATELEELRQLVGALKAAEAPREEASNE